MVITMMQPSYGRMSVAHRITEMIPDRAPLRVAISQQQPGDRSVGGSPNSLGHFWTRYRRSAGTSSFASVH